MGVGFGISFLIWSTRRPIVASCRQNCARLAGLQTSCCENWGEVLDKGKSALGHLRPILWLVGVNPPLIQIDRRLISKDLKRKVSTSLAGKLSRMDLTTSVGVTGEPVVQSPVNPYFPVIDSIAAHSFP